jgi:hypothetical protein
MAAVALVVMTHGKSKECLEIFCSCFEELMTDIDLEKEYTVNFGNQEEAGEEDEELLGAEELGGDEQ